MKKVKLIIVLLISLGFFGILPSFADDRLSCDDLADVADQLDIIADAFHKTDSISEGDEVDRALGQVVDALITISRVENEPALTDAVNSLTSAYNSMNSEKFGLSLDSVITNLDRLNRRDCE